jgi:hypothetical protein
MVRAAVKRFRRHRHPGCNNAAVRDVTKIDDIDLATWRYVTGRHPRRRLHLQQGGAAGAAQERRGGDRQHRRHVGPHRRRGPARTWSRPSSGLVGLTRGLAHDLAPDGSP